MYPPEVRRISSLGLVGLAVLVSVASCDKHREIGVRFTGFSGPISLWVFDARTSSCAALLRAIESGDSSAVPAPLDSALTLPGNPMTLDGSFAAGDYSLLAWSDPRSCQIEAVGCAQVTLGGSSDPETVTIPLTVVRATLWCGQACAAMVECGGTGDAGVDAGPPCSDLGEDCCTVSGASCLTRGGAMGRCCAVSGTSPTCVVGGDPCGPCVGVMDSTPCELSGGSVGVCSSGMCVEAACRPPWEPDASGCWLRVEAIPPDDIAGEFALAAFWYQLDGQDPDEFELLAPVQRVALPEMAGSSLPLQLAPSVPGDAVRVCSRPSACGYTRTPDCACDAMMRRGPELAFGALGIGDTWAGGELTAWPSSGAVGGALIFLWASVAMSSDEVAAVPHFAALRLGADGARFAATIPVGMSVWRRSTDGTFLPAESPLADRLISCGAAGCGDVVPVPQVTP